MQAFAGVLIFDQEGNTAKNKFGYSDLTYKGGIIPRYNFDNLWYAILTVFQIISAEDWHIVMYECTRSTNNFYLV